jgi:hypothetical protein
MNDLRAARLPRRAIGLGVDASADPGWITAIASRYRDLGVGRYYLHLHPDAQPAGLREPVVEAGFERARGWMKFRRGAGAPPPPRSDLEAVLRENFVPVSRTES